VDIPVNLEPFFQKSIMPYPNNEKLRGSGSASSSSCGGKSRMDFSPSLDSIDPKCPQSPVGNQDGSVWDTETGMSFSIVVVNCDMEIFSNLSFQKISDHILSYFLGGDAGVGVISHDESGFATAGNFHSHRATQNDNREDDSGHMLPPTPVVHFYSHISRDNGRASQNRDRKHSSEKTSAYGSKFYDSDNSLYEAGKSSHHLSSVSFGNQISSSSATSESHVTVSSDTLLSGSNIATSMVTNESQIDRPVSASRSCDIQLDHHSNGFHNYGSENASPLSPAALIGLANENLLLPLSYPHGPTDKFDTTKNGSLSPSSNSHQTKHLSSQQPGSYAALSSILESSHEIRILPPERLMEVFRNQNQPLAPVPENDTGPNHSPSFPISSAFVDPSTSANVATVDAGHANTQQNPVILPNQHSVPMNGQHFIIASHVDLAAILNRHHSLFTQHTTPQVESEEKRAKRLERNRESARKSRRKKKERLLTLGEQVNQLHNEIEAERRQHINAMIPAMNRHRLEDVHLLLQHLTEGNELYQSVSDQTCVVIQQSGPNSRLMRSVLEFQYSSLKQLTLPSYHKMLLCLTLLDEKFFTSAKDEYTKRATMVNGECKNANQNIAKTLSSKQIGDDLFNGVKEERTSSGKNKKRRDAESDSSDLINVTANAYDGSRFWPLLCFELRLSVDQEERFLATQKQIKNSVYSKYRGGAMNESDTLENHRSQIAAAVVTAESLSKAVGSLSHVVSRREDKTLARILRPDQLMAYVTWLSEPCNRARFKDKIELSVSMAKTTQPNGLDSTEVSHSWNGNSETIGFAGCGSKEASLQDICRRLNQVLRISMQ
jgi:bZIP transcription factor